MNTWASDVPGWRGYQAQLGLDETSPAVSVRQECAKSLLTFLLHVLLLRFQRETNVFGLRSDAAVLVRLMLVQYLTAYMYDLFACAPRLGCSDGILRRRSDR